MTDLLVLEDRPALAQGLRMDQRQPAVQRFDVRWAQQPCEVREAQRLRYRVFADEMGAQLKPLAGSPAGHDVDRFDDFCEHLLVRAVGHPDEPGELVGTYRVLTPDAARRAGGLYTDTEFDLHTLRPCSAPPSSWAALACTRNGGRAGW